LGRKESDFGSLRSTCAQNREEENGVTPTEEGRTSSDSKLLLETNGRASAKAVGGRIAVFGGHGRFEPGAAPHEPDSTALALRLPPETEMVMGVTQLSLGVFQTASGNCPQARWG
jgi:hypothetical protein